MASALGTEGLAQASWWCEGPATELRPEPGPRGGVGAVCCLGPRPSCPPLPRPAGAALQACVGWGGKGSGSPSDPSTHSRSCRGSPHRRACCGQTGMAGTQCQVCRVPARGTLSPWLGSGWRRGRVFLGGSFHPEPTDFLDFRFTN